MSERIQTVVGYETYKRFATKYGILLHVNGKKKTISVLRREIKKFEKNNKIKDGLYY